MGAEPPLFTHTIKNSSSGILYGRQGGVRSHASLAIPRDSLMPRRSVYSSIEGLGIRLPHRIQERHTRLHLTRVLNTGPIIRSGLIHGNVGTTVEVCRLPIVITEQSKWVGKMFRSSHEDRVFFMNRPPVNSWTGRPTNRVEPVIIDQRIAN